MWVNIAVIAMGTVVPMSKVEGFVFIVITIIHKRMHITGRFKGYFLPVHMANLISATGWKLLALL